MQITKEAASKDGMVLQFTVTQTNPAFMNSIRRAIMEKVATFAIEDVEFKLNNSAMYDEMFAHRLGLLALSTDSSSYVFRTDEGSAANQVSFTLEVDGPCVVTAGMLKTSDEKVRPVHPDTPLVELLEGQSVALEAKAILGTGQTHAKWSSGIAYYSFGATITVADNKDVERAKKLLPDGAFDASGKISAQAILKNNLVDAVDGVLPESIKVAYDDTTVSFTVESWGQLSGVHVVTQAVKALQDSLDDLQKALEVLK